MQLSQATSDLKDEHVAAKRMKGELQQLQDDLADTKAERDSLQKARNSVPHWSLLGAPDGVFWRQL